MTTTKFSKVWYRSGENRWQDKKILAMEDSGDLIVNANSIEFNGKKKRVHITNVKRVSYEKQGRDFVNNWVKIEYDDGKTAFFAGGSWLGWGGILGGTEKIFDAVRHLETTFAQ